MRFIFLFIGEYRLHCDSVLNVRLGIIVKLREISQMSLGYLCNRGQKNSTKFVGHSIFSLNITRLYMYDIEDKITLKNFIFFELQLTFNISFRCIAQQLDIYITYEVIPQ